MLADGILAYYTLEDEFHYQSREPLGTRFDLLKNNENSDNFHDEFELVLTFIEVTFLPLIISIRKPQN